MKHIYEWRPTGFTPIDYNPKRWFHLHAIEVLILMGLGILIGVIGSEFFIAKFFPHPPCAQYTCEHNKLKVK